MLGLVLAGGKVGVEWGSAGGAEVVAEAVAEPVTEEVTEAVVTEAGGESRHERGRRIYNYRCYFCHGYSGNARTLAASFMARPPRDFTATSPELLTREVMLEAIRDGRPGSAMAAFGTILTADEVALVADFVRQEFMIDGAVNTRYHIEANGWGNHERYAAAFPFALGEIALDQEEATLTSEQLVGKRLFMSACITCHDRSRVREPELVWESRPVSFPRGSYSHRDPVPVDAVASASIHALHDIPPSLPDLDPEARLGEKLFQGNCAFCHGADGTGKNWIGRFLEPPPRNLADPAFITAMSSERLEAAIREGIPGSSMPAWKGVLSETEVRAIGRYLLAAFSPGAPPGLQERDRLGSAASRN
ncbi:MAG: c-type cytochrome [Magnetococcales bacterium]|nr:c-type cytochrome [Magnetococcales bacterium]